MSKKRKKIPDKTAERLLANNKHTCCICHVGGKHVQIHHIDEDPSNNDYHNLCVLCMDCHSHVTSNQGFGRKYTPGELKIYKEQWEDRCKVTDTKKNVVNNFFVFTNIHPELLKPNFVKNFMSDITSGTTQNEVYLSVEASTNTVFESTGDQSLADKFKLFVLKEVDF